MKQHNTLTLKQFIIRSVGVYFITLVIFCLFLFKVIPGCSLLQSKLVLFLLAILSVGLIYFEKDDRRNYLSIALNVLMPFGIYTTIAYMPLLTLPLGLVWGILITLNVIYIGLYLSKVKRRNYNSLLEKSQLVIGLASLLSLVIVLSFTLFGSSIIQSSTKITNNTDVYMRKYDEKSLKNLHNWSKLERKEKLNTLQTICNNERDYLGISSRIKVGAGSNLTHAYCQYNNKSKEITFDISQLDHASSTTLLEALLHSTYHAYEYALVESYDTMSSDYNKLFDYRIIATYKKEFSTKVTNKAKYYNQINESNARSYATDALQDYQNRLKK
ncbi:hypothetical protein CATMIT_02659 [Catenibacterium mitsuokai DSM 15897]|uniref:hypothetical protein n=1 Tax=Catenibacterium mitsuokai TaxID=100886 RepID=UPI000196C3D1|nr:hypothetical protein [Catenibacterium mitsuokai]EEF92682.1 hypothetical protein CATMIT_02659 [Catenibacterium mitsuokai DSM 15897]UWO52888.1 hypothetical protein NQ499_11610 [Catenibacterium mitsuokai]